jgi:hypothetical protein
MTYINADGSLFNTFPPSFKTLAFDAINPAFSGYLNFK